MNIQEFAKLKVGDKIRNEMSNSSGEVVAVDRAGVHVRWAPGTAPRHYAAMSTIWFHWSLVEEPARECTAGPCTREDCRNADQCLGGDYDKIARGA